MSLLDWCIACFLLGVAIAIVVHHERREERAHRRRRRLRNLDAAGVRRFERRLAHLPRADATPSQRRALEEDERRIGGRS